MLVYFGLFMLIATGVAMVKQVESRFVLIVSGFIMAIAAMDPMCAFNGFTKAMGQQKLICTICSVMAFAYVMKYTGCDKHLSHAAAGPLRRVQAFLIPGAAIVVYFIQISLPSAAGVSAAAGSVIIPLLISLGVRPAMAGAAVLAGTYGDILSPGMPHNAIVAKLATDIYGHEVTSMDVIAVHHIASICAVLTAAAVLWGLSMLLHEAKGWKSEAAADEGTKEKDFLDGETAGEIEKFHVNYVFAIVPIIPVAMLICGAVFAKDVPWLGQLKVEHTMLIGSALGLAITRTNPLIGSRHFFAGLGKGYADIMGIIIAAGVFVAGMNAVGLVQAGIDLMSTSKHAAGIAAAIGPWGMAVMCGSGNAATIAFNEAVTANAPALGVDVIHMGALATLAGGIGRSMSPIAGCAFICAGLAGVNPMELVKRTALPAVCALFVGYLLLMGF